MINSFVIGRAKKLSDVGEMLITQFLALSTKLWQITQPGIAIHQKLADSEIICVRTY